MSTPSLLAPKLPAGRAYGYPRQSTRAPQLRETSGDLAAAITKAASKQTYYTIRYLVDGERVADAYRAYAYFRWLDDTLDQGNASRRERLAFVARQQALIAGCYQRSWPGSLLPEERMLVDLIGSHGPAAGGLRAYIDNMMAVMAFDAERRGRIISQDELDSYTRWLAVAVTEALHFFIGHDGYSLQGEARYAAATGAHITHMLRDTLEDIAEGYYNVPAAVLDAADLGPHDITSEPYRAWVQGRVAEARACFATGKAYLAEVENGRCRLAGCSYIARFEGLLDTIEREGYQPRAAYPEHSGRAIVARAARLSLALSTAHRRNRASAESAAALSAR